MTGEPTKRLTREDWLSWTLSNIAHKGQLQIRIYRLAKSLGVTEGSFYWHFKNRDDFLAALVDYWVDNYTEIVVETVNRVRGDASTRLLALQELVVRESLSDYDFTMQALAIQEPVVAPAIAKVYKRRIEYVGSLFAEMGFCGLQLEMRTQAFVAYMSFEPRLAVKKSKKKRLEFIREAHAFFTRP
jgi:AcrR family transcriptional regulator